MINRPNWLNKLSILFRNDVLPGRLSYSQEGEDLVLARIFENLNVTTGFFVDIGAHHPTRFSNTYYFYRRGWRGINVDALPGTKKLFNQKRPRDITIECGVGAENGVLTYFLFNEPALNTFSESEANKKNVPPYRIVESLQIPVVTLKQMLDENLPHAERIDFMTIDAEGFDHEVISSNDWTRYRPRVVLVELLNASIENLGSHPTAQLLRANNYRIFAKSYNTYFFVENETTF
jgi:FkbM family methyltransferase